MTRRTTYQVLATIVAAALVACLAVSLLALSGQEAEAAFPGKNGKIAFSRISEASRSFDLFVIDADGSGPRNVTNSPVNEFDPSWSANGKKLVYTRQQSSDYEIAIINVESGSKRLITDNSYDDLTPAFSPDGTKIVFSKRRDLKAGTDIYVKNRHGGGLRRLTRNADEDLFPSWSPDGTKLAFRRLSGANDSDIDDTESIRTMNPDGSGQKSLISDDAGAGGFSRGSLSWSPDGAEIAFGAPGRAIGPSPFKQDIYAVRADGTGRRRITDTPDVYESDPAYSPDGSRIAFARLTSSGGDVWTMNADGSDPAPVTDNTIAENGSPSWQPIP